MTGSRRDGTNPRAQGTNPRATGGDPPAAFPGGRELKAGQEVATQIFNGETATEMPPVGMRFLTSSPTNPVQIGEKKEMDEVEQEKAEATERFMKAAAEAKQWAEHDEECPARKGKECSCRALLAMLRTDGLSVLESKEFAWQEWSDLGKTPTRTDRTAKLVRVDDGRKVNRVVPDPMSQTAKPITIVVHEPPRWICLSCASSMRGTDIDHRCDPAIRAKANSPLELSRTLPPDVKFGGAYRLTFWRDRAGDYWLGEEVVVGGKVIEERTIAGPESYNVIEGAILDASVQRLTP